MECEKCKHVGYIHTHNDYNSEESDIELECKKSTRSQITGAHWDNVKMEGEIFYIIKMEEVNVAAVTNSFYKSYIYMLNKGYCLSNNGYCFV